MLHSNFESLTIIAKLVERCSNLKHALKIFKMSPRRLFCIMILHVLIFQKGSIQKLITKKNIETYN